MIIGCNRSSDKNHKKILVKLVFSFSFSNYFPELFPLAVIYAF